DPHPGQREPGYREAPAPLAAAADLGHRGDAEDHAQHRGQQERAKQPEHERCDREPADALTRRRPRLTVLSRTVLRRTVLSRTVLSRTVLSRTVLIWAAASAVGPRTAVGRGDAIRRVGRRRRRGNR